MLKKCPECSLPISDKAITCPHCGYPLISGEKEPRRSNTKHRRLPNGFGQITKIKNKNLRNPYRAMITVGFNSEGKPICKLLKPKAYFHTYNEAYSALIEYNKDPYDISDGITVKELYEKWFEEYSKTLKSDSSRRSITSAWAYCSCIENMTVRELRARHIKYAIDEGTANINGDVHKASPNTKSRIKSMFNIMLDYAVEYEITDKNYARVFNLSENIINELKESTNTHIAFTEEEMSKLWKNITNIPYVDIILVQCYMGWRPQELGLIQTKNVKLDENIIIGGMKTSAGTNRTVPIHPKIFPIISKYYSIALENKYEYLFICTDTRTTSKKLTYDKYQARFKKVRDTLGLNPEHKAHDPRKQFITMCKKYNVDEYAIKYMAGHTIDDITEKVYTERDPKWIQDEIRKIP